MDMVYKFCGSYGLDILRNLELKVTPPNQFNDPFEFTPKIICSDPARYANRLCGSMDDLKKVYERMRSEGGFRASFSDFHKKVEQMRPNMIETMDNAMRHILPIEAKKHLDRVSEQHGVLCMSQRRDSILMWGHYCAKACGLVIGFDQSSAVFQQQKGMRPVDYVREKVTFDAIWENESPQMADYEDRIIFSKNDDWKYEEEVRQFFNLVSLKKKQLDNGNLGYFLSIPSSAVVSATLGPRCSPELESNVRTILQDSRRFHVKLDRAVLHESEFSLSFKPLP